MNTWMNYLINGNITRLWGDLPTFSDGDKVDEWWANVLTVQDAGDKPLYPAHPAQSGSIIPKRHSKSL